MAFPLGCKTSVRSRREAFCGPAGPSSHLQVRLLTVDLCACVFIPHFLPRMGTRLCTEEFRDGGNHVGKLGDSERKETKKK